MQLRRPLRLDSGSGLNLLVAAGDGDAAPRAIHHYHLDANGALQAGLRFDLPAGVPDGHIIGFCPHPQKSDTQAFALLYAAGYHFVTVGSARTDPRHFSGRQPAREPGRSQSGGRRRPTFAGVRGLWLIAVPGCLGRPAAPSERVASAFRLARALAVCTAGAGGAGRLRLEPGWPERDPAGSTRSPTCHP